MNWIIDDLKNALAQLKRWQTWLVIGLLGTFALLAYLVGKVALKTDALLSFLRHTTGSCRQLTNLNIILLFCGMIFFFFSAVLTLGEIQRYIEFRQRGADYQARQAVFWAIGWGSVTIGIAIAALVFFNSFCR